MNSKTLDFLLKLNQDFYDTYAKSFSSTRYSIQPGIRHLLPQLLVSKNLLDLGCGNGNLAKALLESGFSGRYLGVDNSQSLLDDAANAIPEDERDRFTFRQVDLAAQFQALPEQHGFDTVACFAVIHHFPVDPHLNRFFEFATRNLTMGGKYYLSTWQVKNNIRLSTRIQPWSVLEINLQGLSENDLLLDWRADPNQPLHYRYVHHYNSQTLIEAGLSAGLKLEEEFLSDGKEGDLALYQVWSKPRD
jgi:SAM-dependent methyltransferase